MKKLLIALFAVALSLGAFAEEVDGHTVLYYQGAGGYWDTKSAWSETSEGATKKNWQDGAYAVIAGSKNINLPQNADSAPVVYGIQWNNSLRMMGSGLGSLQLGAGGIQLLSGFEWRNCKANPGIRLTDSQVWTNAAASAKTMSMNSSSYLSPEGQTLVLTAADDVELTLAGSLTWSFNCQAEFTNADVTILSPAKLSLTYYTQTQTKFAVRTLTLDGSQSSVTDAKDGVLAARTLKLRNGGKLTLTKAASVTGVSIDSFAGTVVADEGEGSLTGTFVAGEGALPVEAAEDATLNLNGTYAGADPVKFALTGAGTIVMAGSGTAPEISSVEGFTGTLKLAGPCTFADGVLEAMRGTIVIADNATLQVDYPKSLDASMFEIPAGKTLTLRYATPRPPVTYADGLVLLTGVTQDSDTNGWKFVQWNPSATAAYREQDASYSIAGGALRLDANEPKRRLTATTPNNYFDWNGNSRWLDDGSETAHKWVDGAIASLANKNSSFGEDIAVGGLTWGSFGKNISGAGYTIYLGSSGIVAGDSCRLFSIGEFRLVAPQTWTLKGQILYAGDYTEQYKGNYPKLLTADEDANLTLAGAGLLALNCACDFSGADITLVGTNASLTQITIDHSKWGDRDVMLNARSVRLEGNAKVTDQSDVRVEGGHTIAGKLLFLAKGGKTPALVFATTASGGVPAFDVATIETLGDGDAATISGSTYFLDGTVSATLGAGTVLTCSANFSNATARPGALELLGSGVWRAACTSEANAPVFTAASVADFDGRIVVASGAVLRMDGAVDFPAVELEDGAIVLLKLDRGDKIADWGKVTFPSEGTVTIKACRDDAIAQVESPLDLGMDLSSVSDADRAKIKVVVDDKSANSPYSVTASAQFDAAGNLFAVLSSKVSKKNNTNGGMLWVGKDWGDATDPANWVVYPNGTAAADYDPDLHPTSTEDAKDKVSASGVYSSANWLLDLGGQTWASADGRSNDAEGALRYGVSNGVWSAQTLMLGKGSIDVEYGATFRSTYSRYFYIGSSSTKASPFLFRVHGGAAARIGTVSSTVNVSLYNITFQVDPEGSFAFYPSALNFVNKARTTFANEGETAFPYGFTANNDDAAVTGEVAIVQNAGTLRLAGAFALDLGELGGSACGITLKGGTTVVSNDFTSSGWNLAVAENADFAIEIPKGGDYSTADFDWGAHVALAKRGEGVLRLAAADNVESAVVTLGAGALTAATADGTAVAGLVFDGGALGLDPGLAGNGLVVTNGTVSGTCRVRVLSKATAPVPFLTVAAADDPVYAEEDVVFEKANGRVVGGRLTKEEVLLGGVPCVRYSAELRPDGILLIVR